MCWHHKDLLAFQSEAIKTLSPQRGRQAWAVRWFWEELGCGGRTCCAPGRLALRPSGLGAPGGPMAAAQGGWGLAHGLQDLHPTLLLTGLVPGASALSPGGSHGEPEGTQDPHVPWQRLGWGDAGPQARGSALTPPATVTCRWDRPSEARLRPWLGHSSQRLHQGSVWVTTRDGEPSPALGSPVVP